MAGVPERDLALDVVGVGDQRFELGQRRREGLGVADRELELAAHQARRALGAIGRRAARQRLGQAGEGLLAVAARLLQRGQGGPRAVVVGMLGGGGGQALEEGGALAAARDLVRGGEHEQVAGRRHRHRLGQAAVGDQLAPPEVEQAHGLAAEHQHAALADPALHAAAADEGLGPAHRAGLEVEQGDGAAAAEQGAAVGDVEHLAVGAVAEVAPRLGIARAERQDQARAVGRAGDGVGAVGDQRAAAARGALVAEAVVDLLLRGRVRPYALDVAVDADAREHAVVGQHQQVAARHRQARGARDHLVAVEPELARGGDARDHGGELLAAAVGAEAHHAQLGAILVAARHRRDHHQVVEHHRGGERGDVADGLGVPVPAHLAEVVEAEQGGVVLEPAQGDEAVAARHRPALADAQRRVAERAHLALDAPDEVVEDEEFEPVAGRGQVAGAGGEHEAVGEALGAPGAASGAHRAAGLGRDLAEVEVPHLLEAVEAGGQLGRAPRREQLGGGGHAPGQHAVGRFAGLGRALEVEPEPAAVPGLVGEAVPGGERGGGAGIGLGEMAQLGLGGEAALELVQPAAGRGVEGLGEFRAQAEPGQGGGEELGERGAQLALGDHAVAVGGEQVLHAFEQDLALARVLLQVLQVVEQLLGIMADVEGGGDHRLDRGRQASGQAQGR